MRFVGTALVAGTIGVVFLLAQGGWIRAGTERSAELESDTPRKIRGVAFQYSHFREIAGMEVENVDGEKLGTISDLVLELQSGQPEYVIVKSGGLIVGRRRTIVPVWAMAMKTAKVGIAALDISRQRWMHAPEFTRSDLKLLGQAAKGREVDRFYERAQELVREGRQVLKPTGRGASQKKGITEQATYRLAHDLMDDELVGRQNVERGKISDLLMDLADRRPAYAIATGTDARFAVPLSLLRPLAGHRVEISADRRDFEQAKICRESELKNLARAEPNRIYRYER